MKAISIQQPWAWAIVNGFKPVENRTWRTNYTGQLLIHAGKRELKTDVYSMARLVAGEVSDADPIEVIEKYREERVLGAIVGACVLKKCVTELDLDFPYTAPPGSDLAWVRRWWIGPYGFVLGGGRQLGTTPMRGKLGSST